MKRWAAIRILAHEIISLLGGEPSPTSVQALSMLASSEATLGEAAAGIGHARVAQQQAAMLGQPLLEGRATRALGKLLTRMHDTAEEGMATVERALRLAIVADDPAEMAACLFRVGYATLNAGQLQRCLEATHRRIELARRAQDLF
jgi:hypothetical protein